MPSIVLDYKASVPDSVAGVPPHSLIPQIPNQLQVADLGIFLPEVLTFPAVNRIFLFADVSLSIPSMRMLQPDFMYIN